MKGADGKYAGPVVGIALTAGGFFGEVGGTAANFVGFGGNGGEGVEGTGDGGFGAGEVVCIAADAGGDDEEAAVGKEAAGHGLGHDAGGGEAAVGEGGFGAGAHDSGGDVHATNG